MSRVVLMLCLLTLPSAAFAQAASTDRTGEARARFQDGVAHAQAGDLPSALSDFEAAYALRPHYSVLYNIGQAQLTLGRVVEAIATLERYARDGGDQISADRRREVEATLTAARARTGKLSIELPDGSATRVWINGVELASDALKQPQTLVAGKHQLLSSDGSGFPATQLVEVKAQATTQVRLEPSPAPIPATAQLRVRCAVPDVDIEISGTKAGRTPLDAPLVISPGRITVRLSRPGYRAQTRELTVLPRGLATVDCDPRELTPLPNARTAKLVVTANPEGTEVSVDGQRYLGELLVAGRHEVRVEREGYVAAEAMVGLPPNGAVSHQVNLRPTRARLAEQRAAATSRKRWGFLLGGLGVAAAGGGAALYAWNSGRYDDWSGRVGNSDDVERAVSIQRVDDAAIGIVALSIGFTLVGTWLLVVDAP